MKGIKVFWIRSNRNMITKILITPIFIAISMFFILMNLFPKKKRYTFIRMNKTSDSNILAMLKYHKEKGDNVKMFDLRSGGFFKLLFCSFWSKWLYIDQDTYTLNFLPLSKINVMQLGHGSCRIKAVGKYREDNIKYPTISTSNDMVICESQDVVNELALAYGVKIQGAIVATEPRKVRKRISNGDGILFSPTFRTINGKHIYPDEMINIEMFREFGKKFFIKYHPWVINKKIPNWATDATNMEISECVRKTNIIVSDYSTITADYSMLSKESYFISYVPDIKTYSRNRRLMPSWNKYISDQVAHNESELIKCIKRPYFTNEKHINKMRLCPIEGSLEKIRNSVTNYKK